MTQPPEVLYIGAYSRSGSTLASYLIGCLPGYVAIGELHQVWERGIRDNQLCSCGEKFWACPFWQAVGDSAFGGWKSVDAAELIDVRDKLVTGDRYLPSLLAPHVPPGPRTSALLRRYSDIVTPLYRAIGEVTGGDVLVDSSKIGTAALVLARTGGVRLRVLHLVRDSRGVAFSWMKRGVVRPEITETVEYMDTYTPRFTATRWAYHNLLLHALSLHGVPRALLRYESLVAAPRDSIGAALTRLGLPAREDDLAALGDGRVSLAAQHTIGGNPMRFRGDGQAVKADEAWRAAMTPHDRRWVTTLTWPLLARYGYLRQPPAASA